MKMKFISISSDNNKIFCRIHSSFLFVVLIVSPSALCTTRASGIHALTFYEYNEKGKSYATEYKYVEQKCNEKQSRLVILDDLTKKIIDEYLRGRGKNHPYWVFGTRVDRCSVYNLDGQVTEPCNEQHYYVCEQVKLNSITLTDSEVTITNKSTTITCSASGYPTPYMTWKREDVNISMSVTESIYQTKSSGKSILHLEIPTVTDEGNYKCQASNIYRGSKHTLSRSAKINVPSNPIIESVTGYTCNSSLVMVWKPHVRATAVKHKFTFQKSLSGKYTTIYRYPVGDDLQTITVNNLTSSSQYIMTIQPCHRVGNCYTYSASRTLMTGSVASKVLNATLVKVEGICRVFWSPPRDVHSDATISLYQLLITSSFVYVPWNVEVNSTDSTIYVNSSVLSYLIPRLPNRNYTVYIRAETCAGLGVTTMASGECVTDASAPAFIEQPKVTSTMSDNGSLEIVSKIPDESNGMIRCVFIVVQEFDSFEDSESIFQMRNLSKMNFLISETEYIAIAVERKSIPTTNGEHMLLLGNDKLSYCGVKSHDNKSSEKHESFPADFFVGFNKRLRRDLSYTIFMVTATPSEEEMFFQTSSALVVKGKTDKNLDLSVIAFCVAAAIFLIASIIIVALVKKLRSKSLNQCTSPENTKQKIDKENDIPQLYEYPSINIGSTTHHDKPGAINAEEWKSSKSEYEQVASTSQVHKAHDRHYEIPLNHYELVSK